MRTVSAEKADLDAGGIQEGLSEDGDKGKWQGISGSVLKLVAIATMLVDHVGAALVGRMLSARGIMGAIASGNGILAEWLSEGDHYRVYMIYWVMRQIGRIAFPIYCFLLVEGLRRTRNAWKYAMRLGIFALLSEIPFDLAFKGSVLELEYQNVFFTLAIGLLCMIGLEKIREKTWGELGAAKDVTIKSVLSILVIAAGMGLATLLRTDYSWMGVASILVMYFLREKKWLELAGGYAAFLIIVQEFWAFPAFIALAFYKGKRGFGLKYFFYAFYPVHLLLLYLTAVLMGIAAYPAM